MIKIAVFFIFSVLNPTIDNSFIVDDIRCKYYEYLWNAAPSSGMSTLCEEDDDLCSSLNENPASVNENGIFRMCWPDIPHVLLETLERLEIKEVIMYSDKCKYFCTIMTSRHGNAFHSKHFEGGIRWLR